MSLWQRMDQTILTALQAAMGRSGSYDSLFLQHAEIGEVWQPDKWRKERQFPALLVYSRDVRLFANQHGASSTPVNARYSYAVVAVTDNETYGEARADAQELLRRVILVLRSWPTLFATAIALDAADEERPRQFRWTGATLRVRPYTSNTNSNERPHYAEVSLGFEIESGQ